MKAKPPSDRELNELMGADPEPSDENDPEVKLETFETMKFMGTKPEDIVNEPEFAEEYRVWLDQNP
jgi:hypothetical protein